MAITVLQPTSLYIAVSLMGCAVVRKCVFSAAAQPIGKVLKTAPGYGCTPTATSLRPIIYY
jgi:hypothetical protein